jgi:S1-C subfamily serine protease
MKAFPRSVHPWHPPGHSPVAPAGGASTLLPAPGQRLGRQVRRDVRGCLAAAWVSMVLIFLGGWDGARAEDDLRARFGTRSAEVARLIQEGLQKMEAKQIPEALKSFEKANAADPDCAFAIYWMATASSDLGDLDRAIELFKSIVDRGLREGPEVPDSIAVDSAINLGLTYGRMGEEEKATHFFSRAILLDPKDTIKLAYKAYRNMAISFSHRKQPFSAAICALKAYDANPKAVPEDFVDKMMEGIGTEEVGTPLNFAVPGDVPKARPEPVKAHPLAVEGADGEIVDLQVDPVQDRVFAFGKARTHFYVFEGQAPGKARKVEIGGTIVSGCANAGSLYVILQAPPALAKVDPVTGTIEKQWPLKAPAASVAVYPVQNLAFLSIGGILQKLNLQTSEITPTRELATRVRVDPRQQFCFSDIHPGYSSGASGQMIVNGQPIFFQRIDTDWLQTALVRYAIAGEELLVSSFRLNAASNGQVLAVSPDGHWVAEIGGGGWRPANAEGKAGYGVALFRAEDLGAVQGFFPTDAYPYGAAVNPVAGLIAVFNEKQVRFYDLASPNSHTDLEGRFSRASTWDAGGLTLYVAAKGAGIAAYQIERSGPETQLAGTWVEAMKKEWPVVARKPGNATATAVPGLDTFQPTEVREAVVALIQRAQREGRTHRPLGYLDYAPYTAGAAKRADLLEGFESVQKGDTGVAIFKMKKLLEAEPKHPAVLLTLGIGYYATGQWEKAQASQLEAIHLDAGRTTVSIEALRNLARIYDRNKQPLSAAQCFAAVLLLDKMNPGYAREAAQFFEGAGLHEDAKALLDASSSMAAPAGGASRGLPKLSAPVAGAPMDSVQLFASAVPSVVLVKTDSGSGSGVCIADGVLLTNYHVIADGRNNISVQPFVLANGKLQRLASQPARVLYSNEGRDIALLSIENPPPSMKPLPLALGNPETGTRVYALGSPGFGREVLDQSLSEGIVSAAEREFQGLSFLQHTAAVNPGNSGGPLLNAQGHVVGINTTKATLENVSFAIPAPAIRKLLEKE